MFLFVDTETTGFPRRGVQPRIVSIAWVIADRPDAPRTFRRAIVKPAGFEIPQAASAVHGISTERARREGIAIELVLKDLAFDVATLKPSLLVAHNLDFDRPIIDAEYTRIGRRSPIELLEGACTMLLARRRWPGESARLGDVFQRLLGVEMRNAHDASADVWACSQIFFSFRGHRSSKASQSGARGEDAAGALIDRIRAWARDKAWFDTSFVDDVRRRLDAGQRLTSGQRAALENIVERFRIE